MVSFTPQPLYSREKRQQYPLTIEEGWVPKLSERLAEEKHLAPASNWTIMARTPIPYPRHYIHWVNPFPRTATPEIIETRPRVSRFRSSDGHISLPHYVVILCNFWKKTVIFYSDVRHVRETNAKSDSCLRHVWPAVHSHGTPRLPRHDFSWNFILDIYTETCLPYSRLAKLGHENYRRYTRKPTNIYDGISPFTR